MDSNCDPLAEFVIDPVALASSPLRHLRWEDTTWLLQRDGVTRTLTSHERDDTTDEDNTSSHSPASSASSGVSEHQPSTTADSVPRGDCEAGTATTAAALSPSSGCAAPAASGRITAQKQRKRDSPPLPAIPTWTASATIDEVLASGASTSTRRSTTLQCLGGCGKSWARHLSREVHWARTPGCEARHVRFIQGTSHVIDYNRTLVLRQQTLTKRANKNHDT